MVLKFEFLGSACLQNSKQRDKDAQFFATVSSNLHVDVHFHCSSRNFSAILTDWSDMDLYFCTEKNANSGLFCRTVSLHNHVGVNIVV